MMATWIQDGGLGVIVGAPSINSPSRFSDMLNFTLPNIGMNMRVSYSRFVRPNTNFAEAVFRMEANQGKADLFGIIKALAAMLRTPELKSLRRSFNVWVKGLLKRHDRNTKIVETVNQIKDIFEEYNMAEAAYEIFSETIENTIRDKVRSEVEAEILVRQLIRRFGPLPKWAKTRVSKANTTQLEKWTDAVFEASNLTEVIGAPGRR